jgi:ribonucleoside-diphosphate reductase alpha chain
MTSEIMRTQAIAAYDESSEMAREKGSFPAYDREKFLRSPFVGQLPEYLQTKIEEDGIRNGVLLTVAPTGTTAIVAGCMTGGVEPTFDWHYTRRVRQPDGVTYNEYEVEDYGHRLYRIIHGDGPDLPDYMITTQELSVADHVRMQAACQTWVDASISKTINLPKETSFEDFQEVYLEAHRSGLKSCTTYRPSDVRGAVLISVKARPVVGISTRPRELPGCTYKIKWPNMDAAIYVTICDIEDAEGQARPYEIFFNSRSIRHYEWMIGMSRMISSVFRQTAEKGTAPNFVAEELMQVHSMTDGQWHEGRYVPSIVAAIGTIINEHTKKLGLDAGLPLAGVLVGETCRSCGSGDVLRAEGCITCRACGHSNCG